MVLSGGVPTNSRVAAAVPVMTICDLGRYLAAVPNKAAMDFAVVEFRRKLIDWWFGEC